MTATSFTKPILFAVLFSLVSSTTALLLLSCEQKTEANKIPLQNKAEQATSKRVPCPERLGKNDQFVLKLLPKDTLSLSIPEKATVHYSGYRATTDGKPDPIKSRMQVSSGELVSRLGKIEKRAKFGGWGYIYKDESNQEVIGEGPCLVEGELLVSNLCTTQSPSERYVANSFEAEDFGENYTLIRLDPKKSHKLCILLSSSYMDNGRQYFGSAVDLVSGASFYGECFEKEGYYKDVVTAQYAGAKVDFGKAVLVRKGDGWYQENSH